MNVEVAILIGITTAAVSIGTYYVARMKDAEERGALRQRVKTLEERADKVDEKFDQVMEKLNEIGRELSELVSSHRHSVANFRGGDK